MTAAATLAPLPVYLMVGALYFALCYPLTTYSRFLERRLHGAR
jgi:polar amino acid transport system permease protein